MQSHASLMTAFLLVRKAIRVKLKTFPMILSNMDIWGLAVRGVITWEEAAVGDMDVVSGSAVREDSLNLSLVMHFVDCIVILFIEGVLFEDEF